MIPSIVIRWATLADTEALVPLIGELGYPVEEDVLRGNLQRLADGPADRVWIAEVEGELQGWSVFI